VRHTVCGAQPPGDTGFDLGHTASGRALPGGVGSNAPRQEELVGRPAEAVVECEPTNNGGSALVSVSLWGGGLSGTWLTYRLDMVDGAWRVRGTEGPVAIA